MKFFRKNLIFIILTIYLQIFLYSEDNQFFTLKFGNFDRSDFTKRYGSNATFGLEYLSFFDLSKNFQIGPMFDFNYYSGSHSMSGKEDVSSDIIVLPFGTSFLIKSCHNKILHPFFGLGIDFYLTREKILGVKKTNGSMVTSTRGSIETRSNFNIGSHISFGTILNISENLSFKLEGRYSQVKIETESAVAGNGYHITSTSQKTNGNGMDYMFSLVFKY